MLGPVSTWMGPLFAIYFGPKVGDHLGAMLYSLCEPSELLQWLCHDDCTINIILVNIVLVIIIIVIIAKPHLMSNDIDYAGLTLYLQSYAVITDFLLPSNVWQC